MDWKEINSTSRPGHVYYYNSKTGESSWEKPPNFGMTIDQVRASHILVKHEESRNPSSWKEDRITRTKSDALDIIKAHRVCLDAGEVEFSVLAKTESDCSSAKRGGDLGFFGRGKMMKAFEDVAFSLAVGEISQPVFSDSGIHLILRTA